MNRLVFILAGLFCFGCSEYAYIEKASPAPSGPEQTEEESEDEDTASNFEPLTEPSAEPSWEPEPSEEPATEPDPDPAIDEGFDLEASEDQLAVPQGNVVTILMTLSDLWIPISVADALIHNAIDFASPTPMPKVLVIRDDNHNGEDEEDPQNIVNWINDWGGDATLLEEPSDGIDISALSGYHVAVLSNPGYPPDDTATIDALRSFSIQGYGVIFQGDDMTRLSYPPMEELTRLINIDNGGEYHGVHVDNDAGDAYAVRMEPGSVLSAGISDAAFPYGNDIDTASPASTELSVAAWCTIEDSDFPEKPVITAFSPQQAPLE